MVELSSTWILGALFIWSMCRTTQAADDVYMGIDDDWFYRDKGYGGNFGLYRSQRGVSTRFSQMMVMPQACISYNNANYVKFSFYMDSKGQCHGHVLGTYLISIAHYMHAYFNQQALQLGSSFVLPWDAGFLNCVQLPGSSSSSSQKLYARVGCEQHGYVSATKKFQLRVYTDSNCLTPYSYDKSKNKVNVNGYWLSTALSFGAQFYVCEGCTPTQVAASFKKNKYWYDDDYINVQGKVCLFATRYMCSLNIICTGGLQFKTTILSLHADGFLFLSLLTFSISFPYLFILPYREKQAVHR
jgi:hypothetical protein